MNWLVLFSIAVVAQSAESAHDTGDAPSYTIARAAESMVIDGRSDEPSWQAAAAVGEFRFSWWSSGAKEQTEAKMLWDQQNLYVLFRCQDAHIWAEHTERDTPVYKDDCVEVFTAPNPTRPLDYFNIEMNAVGAYLDQHHPEGPGVEMKYEWNAKGIEIAVSRDGTLNNDGDLDQSWTLEAAIPLVNFASVAVRTPPKSGDVWRLNLNRLGGKTNQQYSQWSPSKTERPSFHAPQDFGRVVFSKELATAGRSKPN